MSISSNVINSIYEDRNNNIWIGTWNGLNKFDPSTQSFTTYAKKDGLPDNVINGVLEDSLGYLWVSTNKGLSKFDPVNITFRNYNTADGLQAQEFLRNSYLKTRKGEFLFGGVNGFNAFYPDQVQDNPFTPPIYITNFSVFNERITPATENSPLTKHISETEQVALKHDQNEFNIEFAALNYSQASKNSYAYILEGYDREWHYVTGQRNANYAKVPQGHYTFRVIGTNNDGLWNEEGAALQIIITPPWWETWWAYTLYGLVLFGILFLYRKGLINRERLKSNLKLEHLELTKMQEMDQLKSNFFTNISHEFRTPLTLILSPLRSMRTGTFKGNFRQQYSIMIRNSERHPFQGVNSRAVSK